MPSTASTTTVYICPWHSDIMATYKYIPRPQTSNFDAIHLTFTSCGNCIKSKGLNYEHYELVRIKELSRIKSIIDKSDRYMSLLKTSYEGSNNKVLHIIREGNGENSKLLTTSLLDLDIKVDDVL
jgi:hypothetical protein